jgi:phage terminase small subunit
MEKRRLTIKQENFCTKYIETGNASEAYRFAYDCSKMIPETINNKAYILLNKGEIRARVDQLQNELREKSNISKERILEELKAISFSDIRDYLDFNGRTIRFKNFKTLTDTQVKAIESIKKGKNGIELKLHGKSWTIERICKMLGYDSPAKNEITGKDGKDLFSGMDLSKLTDDETKTFHDLIVKTIVQNPGIEEQMYKWH